MGPPPPSPPPAQPFSYWTEQSQAGDVNATRGSGRRALVMALVGVVVVALLGVGGWLFLTRGTAGDARGNTAGSTSAAAPGAGLQKGAVQAVGGNNYTVEAVDTEASCLGHAYGATADFFGENDCTGLSRALYSTEIGGQPVVVSVSRVRLADASAARSLRALTDANGSGNVSDLLREGVRYTGSPAALSGAEYASAVSGATVTIVESAWVTPDAGGKSSDIDQVADDGLALQTPPFPAG